MPNATDRNQNARQTAQDEAEAIRGLAKHNQDYRRLPKALQAIVDAYNDLDDADENMAEAQTAASHPDMARQDPNDDMLHELAGLVAHVRAELRRHGVLEGALAWLASHPEGWDDEPEHNWEAEAAEIRSEYRHEDDDRYQISDAEAEYRASAEAYKAEHGEYPESCADQGDEPADIKGRFLPDGADSCPDCGGALATVKPLISQCLACRAYWS